MHVARALAKRPKSEISLSQNPSLTSQEVFGTFLRLDYDLEKECTSTRLGFSCLT